jgi:pimeloyl-ACP methyl ester carboxylesterase
LISLNKLLFATSSFAIAAGGGAYAAPPAGAAQNIALVHGAFADGSGWSDVAEILTKDGYAVTIVQEPETSLADDVKAVQRAVDMQSGPTVLVGHSYGGSVITEAGSDQKVAALVYVAAFQPDAGESTIGLIQKTPPATKGIQPTKDGYFFLDPAVYASDFAVGQSKAKASFMSRSQVMPAGAAFGTPISTPAWKSKPSWAVVATDDRMINPELERFMTKRAGSSTIEIKAGHDVYMSHAKEVAKLIVDAASGTKK